MEKESLISALKERIGEPDFAAISRRSIETIIEPMMPMFADDEKVTEDTYAIPVAVLKSFIGQSRHDIAEGVKAEKSRFEAEKDKAVKDAVEAYKSSLTSTPSTAPHKTEGANDDVNAIIEQKMSEMLAGLTGKDGAIGKLTDSLNTFISDYNARQQQEKVENIRERVKSELVELEDSSVKDSIDVPFMVDMALRDVDFSQEKDYASLLAESKKRYEFYFQKFGPKNAAPFAGGAGGETPDASFQAYLKGRQAEADRQESDAKALREKMM